jgi:hypothetical protein
MRRSAFWRALGFGAAAGALFLVERLRPLRPPREPGAGRIVRNLTIALLAGAMTAASQRPIVAPAE